MLNLSVNFSHPWLLLLLIPAIALTLIPYFRLSRKYRKTRNRITSIVLHTLVMIFTISVLAGVTFLYEVPNKENEIILLVDVSDTENEVVDARDEFVKTVLKESKYDNYKVGVVTFGFNQVYAVPLTENVTKIYDKYVDANLPDVSATDIAAALNYTKDLFTKPETAKIVLITDGKETDEKAASVIRSVAVQGTKVDTAYIPSAYQGDDVQLTGVTFPDFHVGVNEECVITLSVKSNVQTAATIELYDNGEILSASDTQNVELNVGTQTFSFLHTFKASNLHQIKFKFGGKDKLIQNNEYYSYYYLNVFNKILILENYEDESVKLKELLSGDEALNATVMNVGSDELPKTVDELRAYDQVIMNNVANGDLPSGFDEILYSYVRDFGGGLFTVGGNDESGEAHAYNREDMYNTLYQQMLPVQAINYTPPVGVMVVIDVSGSMADPAGTTGKTKLDWAKMGASACLDALSDRDYIGVMTLDKEYSTILDLTQRTKEAAILAAIDGINKADGGTVFPGAISRAGQALVALKNVDKRHIIIVTDGEVPDSQAEQYNTLIDGFYKTNGITLSVVAIGMTPGSDSEAKMQQAVELGHGRLHMVVDITTLTREMREDLNAPEIKEVNTEPFKPIVYNSVSPILNGVELGTDSDKNKLNFELGGFYGVKARSNIDVVLVGDYDVPIYAQWKFGKGTVGSFMCDLKGVWSADLMESKSGQTLIKNIVNSLMPTEDIRPNDISVELTEENYINNLSILTNLKKGEKIEGQIIDLASGNAISLNNNVADLAHNQPSVYVSSCLTAANNYSRCNIVVKASGVYKIVINKVDAEGKILSTYETYKAFSYSKEYDTAVIATDDELKAGLADLANKGNGKAISELENPWEIFENFITAIPKSYDPRIVLIALAIVLFLADIAVRKFKFKWIHEIIRDRKNKNLPK